MSDEIIRVSNSSYAKYEELLTRRDEVRKQAFQYERAYVREFGDLILQVFQIKIECIRKKKTIEYCQAFTNRGQSVDQNALQEYLQKELEEYQATHQFLNIVADGFLRIGELGERIAAEGIAEVLGAVSTDMEGDATAGYLAEFLAPSGVKISRLAFGLPADSGVSYSDPLTLRRAINFRTSISR